MGKLKVFLIKIFSGLLLLIQIFPMGVFAAQPTAIQSTNPNPGQQTVKIIKPKVVVKPEFANLAIPVGAASRPGKIMIAWSARDNATGYYIYRTDQTTQVTVCLNDLDPKLQQSPKSKPIMKRTAANIGDCLTAGSAEMKDIAAVLQISADSPAAFFTAGTNTLDRDNLRLMLSQLYSGAARAMGTGFLDHFGLVSGRVYRYKVVPVINGAESFGYGGVVEAVNEDSSVKMTMPDSNECTIYQGDQTVELLWPRNNGILAYDIYRVPNDSAGKLNRFASVLTVDRSGDAATGYVTEPIIRIKPKPKTISTGASLPMLTQPKAPLLNSSNKKSWSFFVDATLISNTSGGYNVLHELQNGTTYRYNIVPRDILGPATSSGKTLELKATPVDLLKPGLPDPLKFTVIQKQWTLPTPPTDAGCCATCPLCEENWVYPNPGTVYTEINGGLKVSWSQVKYNEEGNPEDVAVYKLWRYSSQKEAALNNSADRTLIGSRKVNQLTLYALTDNTAKSETLYWYRIEVADQAQHSSFSAPFCASYRDNLPPLAPGNVKVVPTNTDADLTQLRVTWDSSRDGEDLAVKAADLAGYRIYRRVCGTKPYTLRPSDGNKDHRPTREDIVKGNYQDFFVSIGTVMASENKTEFIDKTLPPESPYCWEYCVRAFDISQNVSKDHIGNVACGRLTKTRGPRAAVITALTARGNAIRIDWAAPPSVDLYSFGIYRSESSGVQGSDKWIPIFTPAFHTEIRCEDTPPTAPDFCSGLNPSNGQPPIYQGGVKNTYYFIDNQKVESNRKYSYKIISYDFLGNPKSDSAYLAESTSPVMSTFTYDQYVQSALTLEQPIYTATQGVLLKWSAPPEPAKVVYLVYRGSESAASGFAPLATELTETQYTDATARPGVTYWYKVQYVTSVGHYSEYSAARSIFIPD